MFDGILTLMRDPAIGNFALINFAVLLWRFDRRMVRVETILKIREASE